MGRRRKGRRVDGVLLLDKPKGKSSNGALQAAKRLFFAQKAGHTGSLDPLASGLLPLCFGEATKLSGYLLDSNKTYWVRAKLGEKTNTADAEGEVTQTSDWDDATIDADIAGVLDQFRGPIMQVPPMYSALKHDGKRLYELARAGVEVERPPRPVTIFELTVLGRDGAMLDMEVTCSKGTYIRTLVEDIAEAAGTVAHVAELRRTAVGPFAEEMVTLEQLEVLRGDGEEPNFDALDNLLLPSKTAVDHLPRVVVDADGAFYMRQGQPLQISGAPADGLVAIASHDEALIGIGEVGEDGRIEPRRILKKPAR